MKTLTINLENCYGIRRLSTTLDFTECRAYAVYAPNGMMKSSFAQAFKDIASGTPSRDRVFKDRVTRREVLDEAGNPLLPGAVLVLPPYDEVFGDSEKTATLLVNSTLRKEYEQLYREVDAVKERFISAMKVQSKSKRNIESEISLTFTKSSSDFYAALIRVMDEVAKLPTPALSDVPYDLIADEKVAAFLSTHDVKAALKAYIDKYNELLTQSKYFRKGTFDFYNAATVAKTLAANGFFKAKHIVTLTSESKVEVTTEAQLAAVIAEEKASILQDTKLKKTFDDMEKKITKNEMLRDFQVFLADHEEVLALMGNLEKLKEDVWKSYFKSNEALYLEVIAKYREMETRGKQIEAEAAEQRTQWEAVIDIFNSRFFVPFRLEVKNRVSVILGDELAPTLGFIFTEDANEAEIDRPSLLQVLSTGEKKALYILNEILRLRFENKHRPTRSSWLTTSQTRSTTRTSTPSFSI